MLIINLQDDLKLAFLKVIGKVIQDIFSTQLISSFLTVRKISSIGKQ